MKLIQAGTVNSLKKKDINDWVNYIFEVVRLFVVIMGKLAGKICRILIFYQKGGDLVVVQDG